MKVDVSKLSEPVCWMPNPGPQTVVLTRSEFEILYGGARGGGKTDAGMAWLSRHIGHANYRFLVIRRNFEDLSDWLDRARTFYAPVGGKVVDREIRFPSGALGKVGHLKDESAFEKYQGHEYHKMLLEELTQIPKQERYEKLISSCRSKYPELKPQVLSTTNPGGPGHVWVKTRFAIGLHPEGYKSIVDSKSGLRRIFIPAKLQDNPTLTLNNPSYESYLKSLPEKTRRAWLEGDWDVFEGQFFDSWDPKVHICQPFDIPKEWGRYVGIDYGYTNPSAVLWFAVSPQGRVFQYRELYRRGLTFDQLRDEIHYLSRGEKILGGVCDPALRGPSQGTGVVGLEVLNKTSQVAQGGISETIYPPFKIFAADNDRLNGWTLLREYYRIRHTDDGKPYSWLTIFDNCQETIRTVPELVHDPVRPEDVDTDGDDHIADVQRYFVMARPAPAAIIPEDKLKNLRPEDEKFWRQFQANKKEMINGSYV